MTTRMAAHSIEAGEGDVFLSVGVECVSRYGSGYPDAPDTYNSPLRPGNAQDHPEIHNAIAQATANVARLAENGRAEPGRDPGRSPKAAPGARNGGLLTAD